MRVLLTTRSSAKAAAREVSVELVPLILLAESDFVSAHRLSPPRKPDQLSPSKMKKVRGYNAGRRVLDEAALPQHEKGSLRAPPWTVAESAEKSPLIGLSNSCHAARRGLYREARRKSHASAVRSRTISRWNHSERGELPHFLR